MIRSSLMLVACLACAVSTSAQTVAADFVIPQALLIDFPEQFHPVGTFHPLQGVTSQPIDADGNPATEDWLLHFGVVPGQDASTRPVWQEWYRVVAVRSGRVCAGRWFRPHPEPTASATLTLTQSNGRHVFVVNYSHRYRWPLMSATFVTEPRTRVVTLDAPPCP